MKAYDEAVAQPLQISYTMNRVWANRRTLTMLEHKQKIQACVKYKDYVTGKRERAWLVHIHGNWINKVIDAWIREAQGKSVGEIPGYVKVDRI